MADKVKVILVKAWRLHPQGAELELDKPIADLLIRTDAPSWSRLSMLRLYLRPQRRLRLSQRVLK